MFIARARIPSRPSVPVRIMNVIIQYQILRECTNIGHEASAVWVANIEDQDPEPRQNKQLSKQLREVIAGARPNMSITESQEIQELVADYLEIFETISVNVGAQIHCTMGSILAMPGPFASLLADTL